MLMDENDDLLPEYDLDYSKARPNRFAKKYNQMQRTVVLNPDLTEEFPTSESVNEALRFWVRIAKQNKSELANK